MGRRFNLNLCSSGRALGQGQCGLGSSGHVVNRAATYLSITGPLLEDWTQICNIHSQQTNKMCVRVLSVCVRAEKTLHWECFWPLGWDNLEFLQAVWLVTAWQTALAPHSSITPTVSPNQNRHIVCLSVHSTAKVCAIARNCFLSYRDEGQSQTYTVWKCSYKLPSWVWRIYVVIILKIHIVQVTQKCRSTPMLN